MSETFTTPTKSAATHSGPVDLHMLAHVEKWMAMIREIAREQQGEIKFRG
jgi:hypothetical protein